jgi:cyclophilin family peptidyl-prolyl cis-trans isomerase
MKTLWGPKMNGHRIVRQSAWVLLFAATSVIACNRQTPGAGGAGDPAVSSNGSAGAGAAENPVPLEPRLHQPFAEATRQDPPALGQRPPDLTLAGKSVGKLYSEVVKVWDSIHFATPSGKPIRYRAILDTEVGSITIDLRPDLAPNHVRNFVALALVHYYDGLEFERTVHARSQEQPEVEVEIIEGGCPLGTGEIGHDSIGYWLKNEFSLEQHEAGTVAACHGEDPDTAACRFYITLNKAPFLDGTFTIFGKVTNGLDVARRIFSLPVRNDPEYPEGDRPEKPVVIRSVTIETSEASGAWQPLGGN